ncbi:hypothetical protein D9758_013014 [Tetrapyrgos nigripes]|uniref:FAD linked oxidase N-terminal domain-containing protein n=1 Tax=Tetrapyrgos nigripes TaxID=182062 RepID=A0A8H5FIH6_9AGAR|nr:hypothetical protein D9758_013014 [Tetrapyrgos nigripes]
MDSKGTLLPGYPFPLPYHINIATHARPYHTNTLVHVNKMLLPAGIAVSGVYYSSDPEYTKGNHHFMTSSEEESSCVVEPGTAQDLGKIVKGGGHCSNPNCSSTVGVQIAMSRFSDVNYDANAQTVEIGTGLIWDDVYNILIPQGVNVVGGRVSGVGVAGFTLGGGKKLDNASSRLFAGSETKQLLQANQFLPLEHPARSESFHELRLCSQPIAHRLLPNNMASISEPTDPQAQVTIEPANANTKSSGVVSDSATDLQLDPDEIQFFLSQTGIQSLEELKVHINALREEALEYTIATYRNSPDLEQVHAYPCIRRFLFARLRISKHPLYEYFIESMKKDTSAVFLDVGCCFGTDIRKAIADGCPEERIATNSSESDPERMTSRFVAGDLLAGDVESLRDSLLNNLSLTGSNLQGTSISSGTIKHIHASNFFHLFSEENQKNVARRLIALLLKSQSSQSASVETESNVKGSPMIVFGSHVSRPEKGFRVEGPPPKPGMLGDRMFCHSPESWREMWEEVWEEVRSEAGGNNKVKGGELKLEAELVEQRREDALVPVPPGSRLYRLVWSVVIM